MKRFQKGFTLVEIIMVLGIASLITAAVFIAVSGAQRSARDTTRRADTQKLATAIEQWSANNNGTLPSGDQLKNEVVVNYLDLTKFKDPKSGTVYQFGYDAVDPVGNPFYAWTGRMWVVVDQVSQKYFIVTPLESGKYTYTP